MSEDSPGRVIIEFMDGRMGKFPGDLENNSDEILNIILDSKRGISPRIRSFPLINIRTYHWEDDE